MKNRVKILSLLLTICMLAGFFTGCNKEGITDMTTQNGESEPVPTETEENGKTPSGDIVITKVSPYKFDFTRKETLTATPNKIADGYIRGEETLLESFESDVQFTENGLKAEYTTQYKTNGERAVTLTAENAEPGKIYSASFTPSKPLDLSKTPVIAFDSRQKLSKSKSQALMAITVYSKDKSFTSACKTTTGAKAVEYAFNLTSCEFIESIDKIEFSIAVTSSKTEKSVMLSVDKLRAFAVYDNTGAFAAQDGFYTADGCTAASTEGKLTMCLSGKGTLTSPKFENSSESRYDMLMPLRNTIFVVLKNNSTATKLTISYTTTKYKDFNERAVKTLNIEKSDEYKAYYFNLSDSRACDGRLVSFRIEAEGEGDIIFSQLAFEQEKAIYDKQGKIISCTANAEEKTVVVKGYITKDSYDKYSDSDITLYETSMSDESDAPSGKSKLASVSISQLKADSQGNYNFEITCPLYNGNVTRISLQFIAFVTKGNRYYQINDRFYVENFRDFGSNPYSFTLADRTVTAAEFGAKGDGFTNDTAAIQAAIDAVSSAGGGKVILNGDESEYGRRYVATNVKMKDNVELVIEKGAMIWQSQHPDDYAYAFEYGHDGTIPGVNWTHNMHINNLPLLQAYKVSNIKITGGGSVRALDLGSEDGAFMPGYSPCCPYKIHVVPVGIYRVTNIEISDIDILRSNNYNLPVYGTQNAYIANVKMHEVKCVSGDGIGLGMGTKNVYIDRCFLQSNDDGVALWTCYSDPRGILWWHSNPGGDNCIANVEVYRSYIYSGGGKAIAFIT